MKITKARLQKMLNKHDLDLELHERLVAKTRAWAIGTFDFQVWADGAAVAAKRDGIHKVTSRFGLENAGDLDTFAKWIRAYYQDELDRIEERARELRKILGVKTEAP